MKHLWTWVSLSAGLLALTVQFQNCAPAGVDAQTSSVGGEVRIVDDWSQKSLSFPESYIQLHDQAEEFVTHGLCQRQSEDSIQWTLSDGKNQVLAGSARCEMGGFQIPLQQVSQFECGTNYELHAVASGGDEATIHVLRKCPPLLSVVDYENTDSASSCFYELESSGYDLSQTCYNTCYHDVTMAFRARVARDQCGDQLVGSN